ncbi:4-alpha-glucanotransferase [Neorhizobium sp. T786]|uniref:4-alpha-glucanotransferase n=1 Tax=Pseudorhizobium xiangyangii TaxID=2883104 RepID=UPI001CFF9893|nr:4-alpha-glucanotransferase [Neorhizobium xiangyangii]MCB5203751.1 4-alpha-glucanotransferase [Neorhizobium xiangyangii]
MKSDLDRLAVANGISLTRPSPDNGQVPITDATKHHLLSALGVDAATASREQQRMTRGTHKKDIPKSYFPQYLERKRVWGISLQLYELRSGRNWGIGDFEDLVEMVRLAQSLGADFVGLNPLHAPFLADPNRCSPYEPSNRQMLNPLYIAVDKVPGFEGGPELQSRLQALRQTDLVDYVGVAATKQATLRRLWRSWQAVANASIDGHDYEAFVREGGEVLRRHALFETLSSFMGDRNNGTGWRSWPAEYQRPDSAEVAEFADDHADTIRFHMWLQWLAHSQLTHAADVARDAGLRVGLYLDLAVGEAIDGSGTWSEPGAYISDATVGSPPDPFATEGQDWHLAPFHPTAIASGGDAPYRRMVTAAMRYAGAVRIDHAAALRRLFLVPIDGAPEDGAYVNYPQDDLLRILAEASETFSCLVIGEDLGMLPEGLQDDLAQARILSYRILSYEREDDGFKPVDAYPRLSLACISTHDHQTLAGWWRGADIKARAEHGIVPPDVSERHIERRQEERQDLKVALDEAGAGPPDRLPTETASDEKLTDLVVSAHRFVAKTPSVLAAVRLADMTGENRPTNIPGTSDGYPNWKPKLSVPIEELATLPLVNEIAAAFCEERRKSGARRSRS